MKKTVQNIKTNGWTNLFKYAFDNDFDKKRFIQLRNANGQRLHGEKQNLIYL